ncbi:MAG: DHH family phosphoesterase [Patescibacteria group bacterium]
MALSPVFRQLFEAIQHANRILVIGDGRPDGDSVGSSTALVTWLLDLKKDVHTFCALPVSGTFGYLDNAYRFTTDPTVFEHAYDLIIICDAGDLKHGGIQDHLPRTPKGFTLVNIDHHATNARYGDMNVVFPEASSTCEVVYRFFEANNIPVDDRMATSLLAGILTDTGTFSNPATNAYAMDIAGKLIARGARYQEIIRRAFKNKSTDILRLWGLALARLQYNPTYDIATTYFFRNDYAALGEEAAEGVSNFLNAVCGSADTILVLRETGDGMVKGSLRSIKRDISKLANLLGGGGHKKAAGFTIPGRLVEKDGRVMVVGA